ncbi:outer membrane biogenesis protein BamB [Rubripirellula lacrimiformis]|uniref:Outer membrane biogenesis protein BamB n=1 Tax=Rubripirellula lacrimiformis TaxID=1930273 RepID=A0A517NC76_9BACT|nr:PQQ-binding-like beta-propeller repeat protein [Rubripirellula lacrimiformis]QDT04719.1 outer membrane biogenesis protein BamB [Rubripirellula lacrimiformis]
MRKLVLTALLMGIVGSAVAAENWAEFRGPGGTGHADDANLPTKLDDSVVQWQIPIRGRAWSSPVVWEDQIWLTTAAEDGKQRSVLCVDRNTGKVIHDLVILREEEPPFCYPANTYATPTPVVTAENVFVHFGSSLTACLDRSSAEVVWKRTDLECDHHRGPASSPILFDGKLFLAFDGFDVQYVVALDAKTGDTVWKRDRDINYGTDNGDRMKAYGTGTVVMVDGKPQVVMPSAVATIAYEPNTGQPIWTVYHDGMNASARPIVFGDLVLITNGGGGMVAVRPDGHGDVTGTHIEWSERKSVPKKSSPLLVDGLIYMNSDDGVLSCREPETGKVLWQKRIGKEYAASPIFASGYIYFFSVTGTIVTIRPGPEFDLVAESELGNGFMASPAVTGDAIVLRSKSMLYFLAASDPAAAPSKR